MFEKEIMGRLRKDFQVGSEDKNDCLFVGQRIQWKHDDKHGWYTNVHQNVAIDEALELQVHCSPSRKNTESMVAK